MRKLLRYFTLLTMVTLVGACDKGYDELNTSKTGILAINPAYQLNNAVLNLNSPGFAGGSYLIYDFGVVQQIITPNSGVVAGANYNQDNRGATQSLWQTYYRNVIRSTVDIIEITKDDPDRVNLYNMARILQSFAFMVLTDAYGDIPYSEAGKGYSAVNFFPAYESQEDIYNGIISELTAASAALNPSGTVENADALYGGNIDQWKKFANSLLLRAAMRLSKVDPTRAEQIVSGLNLSELILSNEDNAVVRHDNNYQNPMGGTLNGTEGANFYLAEPFVERLKANDDPRLSAIAVRYKGATSGPAQTVDVATTDPEEQVGMPMGHDNSTIGTAVANLGLASFYDFSQADRRRVMKITAPYFLVTAAQTQLLLAEARHRNWINAGDAADYYEAGVRAHMEQMALFDAGSAIASGDIDTYIANNPFDAGDALNQINTEYWIASFGNPPEAFANFRRSGFPDLAPNPYPGREVDFIRRLTYPVSEGSVNPDNVAAAIQRMGPDALDTRVWWDVP